MNLQWRQFLLVFAVVLGASNPVYSQEWTNSFAAINREVDLVRSLFAETNRAFDEKVCAALGLNSKERVEVRYLQISFVFFYPDLNDVAPSYSEMGRPDQLIGEPGEMQRVEISTNEIPLNYIRIFDFARRQTSAELEVLVAVSPVNRPHKQRFLRRTFEFVYNRGWRNSKDK